MVVRKHHAPVGALRHVKDQPLAGHGGVRKHHAPVGALRPQFLFKEARCSRQGAPRTCRCIETRHGRRGEISSILSGSTTHL